MWLPLATLLALVTCTNAIIDQKIKAIIDSLFAPDLFHNFISEHPPNATISPCDNFYRHICPTNLPERHSFRNILMKQSQILRSLQELNLHDAHDYSTPTKAYDKMVAEIQANRTLNVTQLTKEIEDKCTASTGKSCIFDIIDAIVPGLLKAHALTRMIASHEDPALENKLQLINGFHRKLRTSPNVTIPSLLSFTVSVMQMYHGELVFSKATALLIPATVNRLAFLSFMERGGLLNEEFAKKEEEISSTIREEIAKDIMRHKWALTESRFGVQSGQMLQLHLRKYVQDFLPMDSKDVNNTEFIEFAEQLTFAEDMVPKVTPDFLVNHIIAMLASFEKLSQEEIVRTFVFEQFNAFSYDPIDEDTLQMDNFIVVSPILVLRIMLNVPPSVTHGTIYYIYGHEAQHQVQLTSQYRIEHNEFYENRNKCLSSYMQDICHPSMFGENECHSGAITYKEDDSDQVGVRAALRLFRKHHAATLKEKPYAGVNLTNEQLFFASQAVIFCTAFNETQHRKKGTDGWNSHSPMHIRANAAFATLNEFRKAFQCPSNTKMVQTNPFFLERDKDRKYPEVDVEACNPETSGYSYF